VTVAGIVDQKKRKIKKKKKTKEEESSSSEISDEEIEMIEKQLTPEELKRLEIKQ